MKGIADQITSAGHEAYLVGGCLRDLLLGKEPKDWDIATSAKPEEVQRLFSDSVYENQFGTVGIKTNSGDPRQKIIEVTTFRLEGKYTDKRHPDEIKFAKTIEEDLSRRDFTINAMAFEVTSHKRRIEGLVDPFGGLEDLRAGTVRTVGNPEERFREDALRLMRAPRFAVELGFQIEPNTRKAIEELSGELEMIAKERIRDEFVKILEASEAAKGVRLLEELKLLRHILPELREGLGIDQNWHHKYNVFEHSIRALDYAAKKGYPLHVRLAALLHDIGKPRSRDWKNNPRGEKMRDGKRGDWTFYQHQYIGARMTIPALDRLRFSRPFIKKVEHLVRQHMFYYNTGEVTERGIRRIVARVGAENIPDLLKVREADRIGSGVEKAVPYKMRHFLFMIEKAQRDPTSVKMLEVRGDDVMRILRIGEGPKVGWVLWALLDEVLDDPDRNKREQLEARIKELSSSSDEELQKMMENAKKKIAEAEEEIEGEMKQKHRVR
ncbi:MAG: CCA tRNA nucleotidyltransferase [bacterium]